MPYRTFVPRLLMHILSTTTIQKNCAVSLPFNFTRSVSVQDTHIWPDPEWKHPCPAWQCLEAGNIGVQRASARTRWPRGAWTTSLPLPPHPLQTWSISKHTQPPRCKTGLAQPCVWMHVRVTTHKQEEWQTVRPLTWKKKKVSFSLHFFITYKMLQCSENWY